MLQGGLMNEDQTTIWHIGMGAGDPSAVYNLQNCLGEGSCTSESAAGSGILEEISNAAQ